MTSNVCRPGCRSSGFTLVELLVVICIITILAALLLPALSRARGMAMLATCMSNQKQQAAAMSGYLGDNRRCYPVMGTTYNPWWSLIGKQVGGGSMPTEDRPLNCYLGNVEQVSLCPDDRGQWSTFATWGNSVKVYGKFGLSYLYAQKKNLWGVKPLVKHGGAPVKLTSLGGSSASKLLLCDYPWFPNRPWTSPRNRWHSFSHDLYDRRRMATTFADAHAEYYIFPSDWDNGRPIGIAPDPTSELW